MIGHGRHRRAIDKLFPTDGSTGETLSSQEWERLSAHLRGDRCEACRTYYDKRRKGAGRETDDDERLAPAESRAILAVIDERLARTGPEDSAQPLPERATRIRPISWGAGLALAGALAAVILYARSSGDGGVPDAYLPRTKSSRRPSADYYCQTNGVDRHMVLSGDDRCDVGAKVRVQAYAQAGLPVVSLVVCDQGLRCRVKATARSSGEDVSLTSPPVALLDRLQLFVIWSPDEVSDRHVSKAIDSLSREGKCVHEVDQLPIRRGDAQVAFWIHPRRVKPD